VGEKIVGGSPAEIIFLARRSTFEPLHGAPNSGKTASGRDGGRKKSGPAHRALHPFGQVPTYEEGDLALFESGAIVFHIAERHAGLRPEDANARARAITWSRRS
jgi:hypothetical protein